MNIFFALTAAALYFAAIFKVVPGITGSNQIPARQVFMFAIVALVFHAGTLIDLILADNGQKLSMLNVASLMSFIITAITTSIMFNIRIWILLPVIYGFSAITLITASLLPSAFITHLDMQADVLLHILLAVFSYATLMIAALYAIQLAWFNHQLKAKKKMVMNPNLPPLMMVERQLFTIILIGQGLLTLSLLTGFIFVDDMITQGKSHKTVLSVMAWGVYSVMLWGHYRQNWRGKRVIWLSITGAFLLTLAYFGSRFVREIIISS